MRRFLKFSAAIALAHPKAAIAGSMILMGVGGAVVSGMFATPAIVPQPASFFSNGNNTSGVNNGLKTPTNAFQAPTVQTHSFGILAEGSVSPGLGFSGSTGTQFALGQGATNIGLQVSDNVFGLPSFFFQKPYTASAIVNSWWQAGGFNLVSTGGTTAGTLSTYNPGYYPFTPTGGLCPGAGAREPSGVFGGTNNTTQIGGVDITDPGFLLCSVPTITIAAIPGTGAQQATGAGGVATTCVSGSPVSGEMKVTAHVAVAHGITPGQTYTLQAFSGAGNTGYNATYIALPGSTGTALVGETTTGAGTCPANSPATAEGTALGGTTGTITMPGISNIGATGITAKNNQKFCALVTENGDDSPFPGSQAVAMVDDHGNPLPGAPALVPYLNQGTANFNGYITTGTQSAGHPALTVTSMAPYAITGATYSGTTGFVTFTTSTTPMFEPGSEFTVSGMNSTGASINLTYVAVAGTTLTGTSIVGNPLSGVLGTPQAISSPGTISLGSTPQMVSVIMPGMRIFGLTPTNNLGIISPFGTFSSTGTGGAGTYATSTNPASFGFGISVTSSGIYTASGLTNQQLTLGTNFTGSDGSSTVATAGSFVVGAQYTIESVGTTSFTAIGASANTVGIVFTATGVGSGTGTASGSIRITGFGTGLGTAPNINGTYQTSYAGGGTFTTVNAAGVGTPASPALMFAAPPFYQSIIGVAGTLPGSPSTTFTVTPVAEATIGDFVTSIGAELTTAVPGVGALGWSGTLANVADLWMPGATAASGGFPTQAGGAPSTSALAGLCKKNPNNDIQQFAAANGFTVHSLYRLNDPGIFGDSSNATIQGYVTNPGGTSATLNVVSTTQGSLALPTGTETADVTGVGLPVASPATIPLTTSASSTYAMTPNTTAAVGSISAPFTINVGAFAPAAPTPTSAVNGWIDQPSGVPTLHVSSTGTSSPNSTVTFTGSLNVAFTASISGTTLNVTLPAINNNGLLNNPYIGIGTTITGAGVTTATVTGFGTGGGANGTYTITPSQTVASETMHASGLLPGYATNLTVSGGTPTSGMLVTDGGVNITGPPLQTVSAVSAGDIGITPTYYPTFTSDTTMVGTLSTLVPGQYVLNSAITTPVKIVGYGTGLGLTGTYVLNACPNAACAVGSSGSPVAITTTGITDGAPVPTPALTVKDLGAGVTLPVTNSTISCTGLGACTSTGSIPLSGTFDTSALGGTPSTIQAQVSLTAGGPPVAGCSACAWTNLSGYSAAPQTFTASITTGGVMTPSVVTAPTLGIGQAFTGTDYSGTVTAINTSGQLPIYSVTPSPGSAVGPETMTETNVLAWSGTALNIPAASGPLYVSVRASNGTAYAMLQNPVRLGLVFEGNGEGQFGALFSAGQGGNAISSITGLYGSSFNGSGGFFQAGPPIAGALIPGSGQTVISADDRFSLIGVTTAEGSVGFQQGLTTAFGGWPTNWLPILRDGIGIAPQTFGNSLQTQTVGVQNGGGSLTTWCSQAIFCSNASVAGPLLYNAATLTGGQITAKIDNGSGSAGNILTLGIGARGSSWFSTLEPGAVLTDTTGHISGSPTLVNCISGCVPITGTSPTVPFFCGGKCYPNVQTWAISGSAQLVSSENMRADFPQSGGTPWPLYTQFVAWPFFTAFGVDLVKAGTFEISVNGTVVCQDTTVPMTPYNNQGGNCTDSSGNNLGWVDFQTGDYQFTPLSAPPANAVIIASWTHIVSPDNGINTFERPAGYDFFGDATPNVGPVTSIVSKSPGGVSAHVFQGAQDLVGTITRQGYPFTPGFSQSIDWLYATRFPTIPGQVGSVSANAPVLFGHVWGWQGPNGLTTENDGQTAQYNMLAQWFHDAGTLSNFSGTVTTPGGVPAATGVLTLVGAATGQMWEGEVIGCNPYAWTCLLGTGTYIQSLASGTWGASGSTYNLVSISSAANEISPISSTTAMTNANYYTGPGGGFNIGPESDENVQGGGLNSSGGSGPHGWSGQAGMGRIGRRMSALTWGALTDPGHTIADPPNASAPYIDRTVAHAPGCDSSATTAPCFDIGTASTNYSTTATSTAISGSTLTFNGLAAHTIPISDGQAVSCSSGCTGLFVVSVSNPPTQDVRAGQGQIGSANNGFTVTLNGAPGGSNRAFTFGCSGTAGTGSNCIDIPFVIPTTGTYGTAAALANCGENNMNGNTPFVPNGWPGNGVCQTNGIGSLVRNFAIGSNQALWGGGAPVAGASYYDDGINPNATVGFNQSAAFTCHFVAAKVVQCVLGPTYTSGIATAIGQWPAGSTYVEYGDPLTGMSRLNAMMGYVGGQSFPITTPGSTQPPGKYTVTAPFVTATSATYTSSTGIISMNFAGSAEPTPYGTNPGSVMNGVNVTISNFLPSATNTALLGAAGTAVLPIASITGGGNVVNVQGPTGLGTLSITAGSGVLAACGTNLGSNGGIAPAMDLTVGSGGTLIDAYPSSVVNSIGVANGTSCTFAVTATSGTPGTVTIPYGNFEGFGGIGTEANDNNVKSLGVYDNTMIPGNPLSSFQYLCTTASGYCEPGLEAVPFGLWLGSFVSGLILLAPMAAPTTAQGAAFNYGSACSGGTTTCLAVEDQFTTSSLDTTNWNPFQADPAASGRWSNSGGLPSPYSSTANSPGGNVISYCDPYNYGFATPIDTVHMAGGSGNLAMTVVPGAHFSSQGYTWAGACVSGYLKAMVLPATGGFIQVRAKSPDRRFGAWPAIWSLNNGGGTGGSEFDISDGAVDTTTSTANTHSTSHWFGCDAKQIDWATPGGADVTTGFHVYGFEFLPSTSFKVWFDGTLVATIPLTTPTACTVAYTIELLMSLGVASPSTSGFYPQPDGTHNGPFEWDINDVQIYNHP